LLGPFTPGYRLPPLREWVQARNHVLRDHTEREGERRDQQCLDFELKSTVGPSCFVGAHGTFSLEFKQDMCQGCPQHRTHGCDESSAVPRESIHKRRDLYCQHRACHYDQQRTHLVFLQSYGEKHNQWHQGECNEVRVCRRARAEQSERGNIPEQTFGAVLIPTRQLNHLS
jgi:hypothetical protein